jgi:hypothetical protein
MMPAWRGGSEGAVRVHIAVMLHRVLSMLYCETLCGCRALDRVLKNEEKSYFSTKYGFHHIAGKKELSDIMAFP